MLTGTAFIPRNELSEDWADYFDETFEVRRASNALRDRLGLLHSLRYILDSGVPQGIDNPAYLADVAAFTSWLRAQPEVAHVSTITDLLARLNMKFHGDDPAWRKLPDERGMAAQYLLLYELSLPLGQGLEDTVDIGREATQLVAMLTPSDSATLIAFDGRAHRRLARHAPSIVAVDATGLDMTFAHMNHRNIRALLKGVGVDILGIAVVLIVALRSLRLGLLSLLANLAPTTLAYGTWGVLVGRIDLSASVVMYMSLGIVVDDTVHFLSKYCYARRAHGESVEDALLRVPDSRARARGDDVRAGQRFLDPGGVALQPDGDHRHADGNDPRVRAADRFLLAADAADDARTATCEGRHAGGMNKQNCPRQRRTA